MNLQKYSPKTQLVLAESQKTARTRQHQAIEPEHLLRVLLSDEMAKLVFDKLGAKTSDIENALEVELTKLPKVAGASNYLSPRFLKITAAAEAAATRMGSKLVDATHLLVALADPGVVTGSPGRILRDHGVTKERLEGAL